MSIFGQVWVFSAAAFALGAFLAWLFLVRPVQRRIRELEHQLAMTASPQPAAIDGTRETATLMTSEDVPGTGVAGTGATVSSSPPPPDLLAEPDIGPDSAPAEATHYLDPEPIWSEWDSHQDSYTAGSDRQEESTAADLDAGTDFDAGADLDRFDDFSGITGGDEAAEASAYTDVSPVLDREGMVPDTYEQVQTEYGEAEQEGGLGAPERTTSLFEPVRSEEPAEDDPAEGQRADEADFVSLTSARAEEVPAAPFDEPTALDEQEESYDQPQALPKRQPQQSVTAGFDPPEPVQPSIRSITRRDPEPDSAGTRSGSLFEPTVAPAGFAPPAREAEPPGNGLPPGPFGPGSAMPLPDGDRPSEEFTVKASVTVLRYCTQDSPQFSEIVAEVWFRTPADAERVGFRPLN